MNRITIYVIADILKNKILLGYTLFLLLVSFSVFSLEDNPTKGLLSMMNLILFIVPLVSIIFSTIYIYNSAEFIELLVSQPLRRRVIWLSLFSGIGFSLLLSFIVGAGLPILFYDGSETSYILILVGSFLTLSFVTIAMLAAVYTRDKATGIGISIMFWLYFALLFDGLILFLLFQFSDYPVEKIMVVISAFNPIDLSRIIVLLHMDVSALMGYTGAVFREYLGSTIGLMSAFFALLLWIILPLMVSIRKFVRMDL